MVFLIFYIMVLPNKIPKKYANRVTDNPFPVPKKGKQRQVANGPKKKLSRGWKKQNILALGVIKNPILITQKRL